MAPLISPQLKALLAAVAEEKHRLTRHELSVEQKDLLTQRAECELEGQRAEEAGPSKPGADLIGHSTDTDRQTPL